MSNYSDQLSGLVRVVADQPLLGEICQLTEEQRKSAQGVAETLNEKAEQVAVGSHDQKTEYQEGFVGSMWRFPAMAVVRLNERNTRDGSLRANNSPSFF